MKKIIFALALTVLFCSSSFAWIDTEGSTFTTTGGDSWEMKDIQNDVHDVAHHAWTVFDISTGPSCSQMWVWDSDLSAWIQLTVSSTNADAVAINSKSQNVKSFLYGYNGSSWDRIKSDALHYLWVRSSTDSVTQARLYDWNGSAWQTTDIYGLARSSAQDTTITRLDTLLNELYGLSRSTGTDTTITRLNTLLSELYGLSRSTGTDISITRQDTLIARMNTLLLELYGLSRSTGTDISITRMDTLLTELYGLSRSTGTDASISRMDTLLLELYGLSRSSGTDAVINRMDSLRTDIYGVARSTGLDLAIQKIEQSIIALYGVSRSTGIDALINKISEHILSDYGIARSSGIDALISRMYQVLVATGSFEVTNWPTDYPDSTSQSSLSSMDTTLSNIASVVRSTPQCISPDYNNRVSTGTAGKIFVTGEITVTGCNMDQFSFYSTGGDTEITSSWTDGIMYCLDGIPIAPMRLSRTISNPVFKCSMSYGTTLYYILTGVR